MEDIKAQAARAIYGDYAQNNPTSISVGHDLDLDGKIELPGLPEYIAELDARDVASLKEWMLAPNGSLRLGRTCFEAVAHGGIFVRTLPWSPSC